MKKWLRRNAAMLILLVALPLSLFVAGRELMGHVAYEGAVAAAKGLRRAELECYALEGFYPSSPDYLYQCYGVQVDTGRYIVHYQYVADNLMPDITVFEAGGEEVPS